MDMLPGNTDVLQLAFIVVVKCKMGQPTPNVLQQVYCQALNKYPLLLDQASRGKTYNLT